MPERSELRHQSVRWLLPSGFLYVSSLGSVASNLTVFSDSIFPASFPVHEVVTGWRDLLMHLVL